MKAPKEKAEELIEKHLDKMFELRDGYNSTEIYEAAKESAKNTVDEILSFVEDDRQGFNWKTYYKQVKHELNKSE